MIHLFRPHRNFLVTACLILAGSSGQAEESPVDVVIVGPGLAGESFVRNLWENHAHWLEAGDIEIIIADDIEQANTMAFEFQESRTIVAGLSDFQLQNVKADVEAVLIGPGEYDYTGLAGAISRNDIFSISYVDPTTEGVLGCFQENSNQTPSTKKIIVDLASDEHQRALNLERFETVFGDSTSGPVNFAIERNLMQVYEAVKDDEMIVLPLSGISSSQLSVLALNQEFPESFYGKPVQIRNPPWGFEDGKISTLGAELVIEPSYEQIGDAILDIARAHSNRDDLSTNEIAISPMCFTASINPAFAPSNEQCCKNQWSCCSGQWFDE